MEKSINDFIGEQLKRLEINDYNDQIIPGENVIVFKKEIDDQIFLVNLIYQTLDDILIIRLI